MPSRGAPGWWGVNLVFVVSVCIIPFHCAYDGIISWPQRDSASGGHTDGVKHTFPTATRMQRSGVLTRGKQSVLLSLRGGEGERAVNDETSASVPSDQKGREASVADLKAAIADLKLSSTDQANATALTLNNGTSTSSLPRNAAEIHPSGSQTVLVPGHAMPAGSTTSLQPPMVDPPASAVAPAVAAPPAPARAGAGGTEGRKGGEKSQSRFQFPVQFLIDDNMRKGGVVDEKNKPPEEDAVAREIEAIEAQLKAELAANPANVTNIHQYFRFMNMVTEDEETVAKTNEAYQNAMAAAPKDVDILFMYGNFLFEVMNSVDQAEEMYTKVLQNDPMHVLALSNLATIHHVVNENLDMAEDLFRQALDYQPGRPDYFTKECHDRRNSTGVLPSPVDYAAILVNFGSLLHDGRGDTRAARAVYGLGLQYDPDSTVLLNNMANILAEQQDFRSSEALYRRALLHPQEQVTTCHNYGVLLAEMKQLDKAAEMLNKALQINPFHIPTCLAYGRMLLETKMDIDGAERMYKRSLKRNPGHVHALIGYAQVAFVKGDLTLAEELYSRATDFHERSIAALIHKGLYLELARKQVKLADEMYGRAQELDAAKAREMYDRLLPRHALLLRLADKYKEKRRNEGQATRRRRHRYSPSPLLRKILACFGFSSQAAAGWDFMFGDEQEAASPPRSPPRAAKQPAAKADAQAAKAAGDEERKDAGRTADADGEGGGDIGSDILYDKGFDERVARARSWDEIRSVTAEYLQKMQNAEGEAGVKDVMMAFAGEGMGGMDGEEAQEPDLAIEHKAEVPEPRGAAAAVEGNPARGELPAGRSVGAAPRDPERPSLPRDVTMVGPGLEDAGLGVGPGGLRAPEGVSAEAVQQGALGQVPEGEAYEEGGALGPMARHSKSFAWPPVKPDDDEEEALQRAGSRDGAERKGVEAWQAALRELSGEGADAKAGEGIGGTAKAEEAKAAEGVTSDWKTAIRQARAEESQAPPPDGEAGKEAANGDEKATEEGAAVKGQVWM